MKIFGDKLQVGDTIWYEWVWGFKQGTIVNTEFLVNKKIFVLDNDDRIPINDWYYTDRSDITIDMIDTLIQQSKERLFELNEESKLIQAKINALVKQLNELEKFKNE